MYDLDLDKSQTTIEIIPQSFFEEIYKSLDISNLLIESLKQSFREIRESAVLSLSESFSGMNQNLVQIFTAQLNSLRIPYVSRDNYLPTQTVEVRSLDVLKQQKVSRKTSVGVLITAVGTFKYKRKNLSKLSMKNAEGRVLALFMNSNLFASDGDIKNELRVYNQRDFGWVIRNLKDKFKGNGLILELERIWNPDGYIIRSIKYLQ